MRFAEPFFLFGALVALAVAIVLVFGGLVLVRSVRRFGEEALVQELVTGRAAGRRAAKGVLLVLAVTLAFVAQAQPQYGRGTRLIPATNLDVVIVLDYSKSMYARDVTPSRIAKAKSEVELLIRELPGARFGAVAFSGQPMSFPLTSDGAAIAQFFRQLSPHDMPVGGTAIARALSAGKELLERDPISRKHKRVMVLVTDGEDLEGNPVAVANSAAQEQTTIHVVQIGGRTPEPIPEVNEAGQVVGMRRDAQGQPLTTELSAEGEEQLAEIARSTGGVVVQSTRGGAGVTEVAARLKRLMTEELSEKVETVYADVFFYPLAAAILLLLVESFISETRPRPRPVQLPAPRRRRRKPKRETRRAVLTALVLSLFGLSACEDGSGIFMRNAPAVDEAIAAYDAGDAAAAATLLQEYLSTGECKGGQIGLPDNVRDKHHASFDLGLALFELGEQYGRRFGEEEPLGDAGLSPEEEAHLAQRGEQVDCALEIVRLIARDQKVPLELRAHAHYLAGNLEFLRRDYRSAVLSYDQALRLIPGLPGDAGDPIGRDAAWNRAIAQRRIQDEPDAEPPDAGQDAEPPEDAEPPDAEPDAEPPDAEPEASDAGQDDPDASGGDQEADASPDGGEQGDQPEEPEPEDSPDAASEPPPQEPSMSLDERMLDMLEQAPPLQAREAQRPPRVAPDKDK